MLRLQTPRRRRGGTRVSSWRTGRGRRRDPVRGFRAARRTSGARASREGASGPRARDASPHRRGCDAQRHLLDALARRSATIAATGGGGGGGGEPAAGRRARGRARPRRRRPVASAVRAPRTRRPVDARTRRSGPLPGRRASASWKPPPRSCVRARAGAPELAAALTWHLGENVNFACGEHADRGGAGAARVCAGTDTKRPAGVGDDTGSEGFSAEKEGRRARRRPPRGARRRSPPRWPARRAPADPVLSRPAPPSALATVALRSGEPFRCSATPRSARLDRPRRLRATRRPAAVREAGRVRVGAERTSRCPTTSPRRRRPRAVGARADETRSRMAPAEVAGRHDAPRARFLYVLPEGLWLHAPGTRGCSRTLAAIALRRRGRRRS